MVICSEVQISRYAVWTGPDSTLLMTPRVNHVISFEFMPNQIWCHRSVIMHDLR